jgi:glycosyltransferase involved in cell wall biosynthesis
MEAMASGLPAIGVNAVALPELVHDKENGFLYEEGDSKALSNAIVTIFSDTALHEKMSQRSLEIIQHHDINKTMKQFETLYEGALASQKEKVTVGQAVLSGD